jgi:hypothetical protein
MLLNGPPFGAHAYLGSIRMLHLQGFIESGDDAFFVC